MSDDSGVLSRWQELRRHPAVQAAAVYVGGSWALIQVADIFLPNLDVVRALGIVLALGFFVVVGGAWYLASRPAVEPAGDDAGEVEGSERGRVRRRRRRFAYTAAAALLVIGGVFWWIRPNILGAVNPDAQVIAVLPFNTSGPGVELLGEGVVDLLSPNLDAVGGIRTVDSRTVLHRWRQRATAGGLDLDGSLGVGRDVDAGSVLLGSVVSVGSEVVLRGELYSVRGGRLAQAEARGPADSVLVLVDRLAANLLREIWLAREPIPNLRVAGITTEDVGAIRAYLKGQQYYRASQWDSALVAFQAAIAADSTFALAHYRLALTYGWSVRHGGFGSPNARRHAELALRYAARLPEKERTLVAAHQLFEVGDLAAHDTMVRYVNRYGGDPEGWYMLGDVRYHAQPILGLALDDLLSPFDRLLELDPSLAPAMIHPLELSLVHNDSARYLGYLTALRSVADSAELARFELARLFWDQPDSLLTRLEDLFHASGGLGGTTLLASYQSKRLHPNVFLNELAEVLGAPEMIKGDMTEALGAAAMLLVSLGRLNEAAEVFDSLWVVAPNTAGPYLSILPVLAGLADTTFALRALQSMRNPPPLPGAERPLSYLRMLYALSQGRVAEGRREGQRLLADTAGDRSVPNPLVRAALGWADIIEGDTLGGLRQLRAGLEEAGYGMTAALKLGQPLRFAFISTLAAYPQTRAEGIRRLRAGFTFGDVTYLAFRYLLLGQALEADGDAAGAVQAYSQFIRLWDQADPELQPLVETARRGLERLRSERTN